MKILKACIYLMIFFIILVVAAVSFVVFFIDPNDYREKISDIVRKKANIELTINGGISWKFYPRLGISLKEVSIANISTQNEPLASVDEVETYLELKPLLSGLIEIKDIYIDGLTLNVIKKSNGDFNWLYLNKKKQIPLKKTPVVTSKHPEALEIKEIKPTLLTEFKIASIVVKNSLIQYQDQITQKEFLAKNINLTTKGIESGKPINFQLKGNLSNQDNKYIINIDTRAQLDYQIDIQKYRLDELTILSELSGDHFKNNPIKVSAKGIIEANLAKGEIVWKNPNLNLNQLELKGDLNISGLNQDRWEISSKIESNTFDLKTLLKNLNISLPSMKNHNALTKGQLNADLKINSNQILLDNVLLTIDNTKATGKIHLTDLVNPSIMIDLKGDQFNLDQYLSATKVPSSQANGSVPPNKNNNDKIATKTTNQNAKKIIWSQTPIFQSSLLNMFNFDLNISFNEFSIKDLSFAKFITHLQLQKGVVTLHKLEANLFEGSIALTGSLDTQKKTPLLTLKPNFSEISLERLFASSKTTMPLSGNMYLSGVLKTQGISQYDWIKNLSGPAQIEVINGTLNGINYEYEMCLGLALLNREHLTEEFNKTNTKFESLRASLNIAKGVAYNSDLIIAIPGMITAGNGTLDLNDMNINYDIGLLFTGDRREHPDKACRVNKYIATIPVPLKCHGSIIDNSKLCRVNDKALINIATSIGKEKLQNRVEEKIDKKLEKKFGDQAPEIKGLLEGLFK